ncbi:hypothetical protein [Methylobacterium sp. Leaf112]|uniref:hypothetical protein n=1 Tax=Methylobacterium sp. Leaf112 TaxID=1736258 RepID=UPI0006F3C3DB|nr:hypothetical protein [Methylobacterium sp. Leaf112]KQP62169.1 hypothetical protein ASF52_05790 [Methylobacterium sp. Leaf112]
MTSRERRAARELHEYLARLFGPEATIAIDPMPVRPQHADRVELEATVKRTPALPADTDARTRRRDTPEGAALAVEIAERYVAVRSARYALPSGLVPTMCDRVSEDLERSFPGLFPAGALQVDVPWLELVRATAETLAGHDALAGVVSAQVKSKFAELRWYVDGLPEETGDEIAAILDAASFLSSVVCEACGAPGAYRKGGWVRILCDDCNSNRRKKP